MDAIYSGHRGGASESSPVRIDCAQIPRIEVKILSHTLFDAVERFYENPENRRRFEEWQRERMEKNTNGNIGG